jgi:polar amino acid transport system substrate-binding protein
MISRRLLLLAMPALVLVGCKDTGVATPSPHAVVANVDSAQLVEAGKLTFCTDESRKPWEFLQDNALVGADVEIGRDLAERLGLGSTFRNTPNSEIAGAVLSGKCDAGISALAAGSADAAGLAMSPYYELGQALLVKTGNPLSVSKLTDLCGKSVGVLAGSAEEAAAKGGGTSAGAAPFATCAGTSAGTPAIRSFASDSDAVSALAGGTIDAVFADSALAGYELGQTHDVAMIDRVTAVMVELGIGTNPSKGGVKTAVDAALAAMIRDGFLDDILRRSGPPPRATARSCCSAGIQADRGDPEFPTRARV